MSDTDPLALLHQTLRLAQLSRGMTMTAVANRSKLSRTTVSQAFNSPTPPSEETLAALAPVLRLNLQTLLAHRRACREPRSPISARVGTVKPVGPVPVDDLVFETRYRDYLKTRHGQLTVVGLDLRGPAASSWPLDAAYLSLELGGFGHAGAAGGAG
ncbi:helix-turn-helix domain-containing protein [Streptomyces virginiae]|uniref:helix-turn-helix domain-containing protein n=1 Tax=Streptomyces virginiae TaxID=1961 RepID=UPI00369EC887